MERRLSFRRCRWQAVALVLLALSAMSAMLAMPPTAALAQEPEAVPEQQAPGTVAPAAPPGTAASAKAQQAVPKVIAARSTRRSDPGTVALGESIVLVVEGLDRYLTQDESRCASLVLVLDEVYIDGSQPEACDPYSGEVRFLLDRTDKSDDAWHSLLAEPVSFVKEIPISVAPQGSLAFPTQVKDFDFEILPALELYGFFAGLLVSLILIFRLASRTALLRDPDAAAPSPGAQAPYSLARFQLTFWTFLVVAAYLFIWMITEELDTLTGSVLVLLGIGSGTALAATMIDQGREQPATGDASAPRAASESTTVSRGFLQDVLSDSKGISIHRFQLFVWTLVLGVIFCASVYKGLAMPQFSTTLLGLMGLSSGTYLGSKLPDPARRE